MCFVLNMCKPPDIRLFSFPFSNSKLSSLSILAKDLVRLGFLKGASISTCVKETSSGGLWLRNKNIY